MRTRQAPSPKTSLLLCIVFSLGLLGCGSNTEEQPAPDAGEDPFTQEMLDFLENDEVFVELAADSGVLIQAALERGDISLAESVALNYDAWLAPELLPLQYQSDEPFVWRTMQRDMQWVIDSYSTLTVPEQEKYASFLLPPTDPESDFYPEEMAAADSKAPGDYVLKTIDFIHEDVVKATITYTELEGEVTAEATRAEWVKTALGDAWTDYQDLFSGQPEPIPIYLIRLKELEGYMGLAVGWFLDGSYLRSRIFIDSTMTEKDTAATTVHEVFHCFQHTLGMTRTTAQSWLAEATAVWSEDHIYPGYNTEWAYLDTTFAHFDKDRIRFDGNWEYSNYLFFFFAEQHLARHDFIVKILKDALSMPVAEAVTSNFSDFPSLYAQYAKYCLNGFDWKLYTDDPAFKKIIPYWDSKLIYDYYRSGLPAENMEVNVNLGKGGITYQLFYFEPRTDILKRLEFDLSRIPDNPNIRTQAFFKYYNADWYEEDWTHEDHPTFCKTDPQGMVFMVALVISNADLENQQALSFDLKVDGDCTTPEGYINYTETFSIEDHELTVNFNQRDTLEYDAARGSYVVLRSTKVYTESGTDVVVLGEGIPPCTLTTTSEGTLDIVYPENERPSRILLKPDGSFEMIAIETDDHDPENWVTRTTESTCGDTQVEEASPLGLVNGVELTPADISPTSIQGSRSHDFGDMHVDIVFSYDRLTGE